MRQLSLYEMNHVSGALSVKANLDVDFSKNLSMSTCQLAAGSALAYYGAPALIGYLSTHAAFLAPIAPQLALAGLFTLGYASTPYVFSAANSVFPAK